MGKFLSAFLTHSSMRWVVSRRAMKILGTQVMVVLKAVGLCFYLVGRYLLTSFAFGMLGLFAGDYLYRFSIAQRIRAKYLKITSSSTLLQASRVAPQLRPQFSKRLSEPSSLTVYSKIPWNSQSVTSRFSSEFQLLEHTLVLLVARQVFEGIVRLFHV